MWAIANREDPAVVADWAAYFDLSLPVLVDETGAVKDLYPMPMAFPTGAYPQQWLIGKDGRIVYIHNRFDHEKLSGAIERALAE